MDLLKEVNMIDAMSKTEIREYAKEKAVNLMSFFSILHEDSNVFENYGLDPVEFFVKLCFACISSNEKGSKEEYDLFKELTCDYANELTFNKFKEIVKQIDIIRLATIVDKFVDVIGEQVIEAKHEIVRFCLCFIAIDGKISDGELTFINMLAS